MSRIAVNQVPAILFEELSGERRTVTLTRRALPIGTLKVGRVMRKDIYYSPGNPEGALSLFGSEEAQTQLQGTWHTKYLGGPTTGSDGTVTPAPRGNPTPGTLNQIPLDTAQKLVDIFDEFVTSGMVFRFSWGPVVRVGILGEFHAEYKTLHDVAWTMSLDWIGRDDPRAAAVFTSEYADIGTVLSLSDRLSALQRSMTAPFNAVQERLDGWQERLNNVRRAYNTLRDVLDTYTQGVNSIAGAANSTVNQLRQMTVGLDQLAVDIAEESVESLCGVVDTLDLTVGATGVTPGDRLRAAVWKSTTVADINAVNSTIARALLTAELRAETNTSTYIANTGDTLQGVSSLYYDTPDRWHELMVHNGLSGSTLLVGQIVSVPLGSS